MSKKYFLAVDAGTGSVRAVLFDLEGSQIACVQQEWEHKEDPVSYTHLPSPRDSTSSRMPSSA